MSEFLSGDCMLTRVEYFLFGIGLLFLKFFSRHFPEVIKFIAQDLVFVEVSTLNEVTVVKLTIYDKSG